MKLHLGGLCVLIKVNAKKFDKQITFYIQHTTMVVYELHGSNATIRFHDDLDVRPIVTIRNSDGSTDEFVIETVQPWTIKGMPKNKTGEMLFQLTIECQVCTFDEYCRLEFSFPRPQLRPAVVTFVYNNNNVTQHNAAEQLFKVLTKLKLKQ